MDWSLPEGGFYIWTTLKNGMKAVDVWRTAVHEGVAVNNGAGFVADGSNENECLRIAYPWTPEDQFAEAAHRLRLACERVARGDVA